MINKVSHYFAIPLAICCAIFIALKPSPSLDVALYSTQGLELDYSVQKLENNMSSEVHLANPFQSQHAYFPYLGKSYHGFKEAIAFKESRGDYFTVNTLGYLGKYQFGSETLKMIGIYNPNHFLNTPELQEKAFLANTERNKWILRKDIERFNGKNINGVLITESGILAAAHLAGPGSVKKFLRSYGSQNFADAYGSTVKTYMKKFSGYDTSSIVPDRRAKVVL